MPDNNASARRRQLLKAALRDEDSGDETPKKRLNVDVDAALYKQIRRRALEEDRSVADLTRELWILYLNCR